MNNEEENVIGFIGAGRVGFSLGRYFVENGLKLSGYYSKTAANAKMASEFTNSNYYESMEEVIEKSDIVFMTVTDSEIVNVWNYIKSRQIDIVNKILCHCSGAMSSSVFSGINETGGFGFSIHPILAVSDKLTSYQKFSQAFFTIEGNNDKLTVIEDLITKLGNDYQVIMEDDKVKYHASAVFASNLVTGLYEMAGRLLCQCGFDEKSAGKALLPLFINNANRISEVGIGASLTGPVDRNDGITVKKHLEVLEGDFEKIYKLLSNSLVDICETKYKDRDYSGIKEILNQVS